MSDKKVLGIILDLKYYSGDYYRFEALFYGLF